MSDAKPAAATAPAKSSKKLLIIILAAVVVLGGGGAGAWFAFAGKGDDRQGSRGRSIPSRKSNSRRSSSRWIRPSS